MKNKDFSQKLKAIGWFQIIGGILGIVVLLLGSTKIELMNGAALVIVLTGLGLHSFSIYAGNHMLKNGNKKRAIILSLVNQSLQIFQFKIAGIGLAFSTLFSFTVGYRSSEIGFDLNFLSFYAAIENDDVFFIMINIVAVLICGVLLSLLDSIKSSTAEMTSVAE